MKQNRFGKFNIGVDEPVCKFGPGGDFVRDWPARKKVAKQKENPLSKVLTTIAEILGTTIRPELPAAADGHWDIGINKLFKGSPFKEEPSGADNRSTRNDQSASTGSVKSNSNVRGEPLLFADDRRAGRKVKRKPNYRIRTYRRTSKKRVSAQLEGQGTLFEINGASQPAA